MLSVIDKAWDSVYEGAPFGSVPCFPIIALDRPGRDDQGSGVDGATIRGHADDGADTPFQRGVVEGLETSLICGKIFCRSKICQNLKLTRRSCFASVFDLNRQMDAASRHMRDKYPYSITVKRGTQCMRE